GVTLPYDALILTSSGACVAPPPDAAGDGAAVPPQAPTMSETRTVVRTMRFTSPPPRRQSTPATAAKGYTIRRLAQITLISTTWPSRNAGPRWPARAHPRDRPAPIRWPSSAALRGLAASSRRRCDEAGRRHCVVE